MKLVFCLLFLAGSTLAQRQVYKALNEVRTLSYVNQVNFDGSYKYSYVTGNGISVQEEGFQKNPGQKNLEAQTARGSYTYIADSGQLITVNWYADATGFHAPIYIHQGGFKYVAGVIPFRG